MRDAGEAITAVRIVMECLITREIKLNTTLLTSEAFTMPDGFTATKLLVLVHGLSTATALVDTVCGDHRTMDGIASGTGLTIGSNTTMSDTSMATAATRNGTMACSAKKLALVTRITEEVILTKILLALIAVEAVKVIVLCANDLIQQSSALLLANRADNIRSLARSTSGHCFSTGGSTSGRNISHSCTRGSGTSCSRLVTWRSAWRILSIFDGSTATSTEARTIRKASTTIHTKDHCYNRVFKIL